MATKIIKVISINISILAVLFIFLELLFRTLFPEFRGQVYTKTMSYGKNMAYANFRGVNLRVPYKGYQTVIKDEASVILVIGDSISYGLGCAYEDIYWRKFERMVNAISAQPIQVISLPGYGDNLEDSAEKLQAFLAQVGGKPRIKSIIYQFNFNDIMPYREKDIKAGAHLTGLERTDFFKIVNEWRYQYFNRSVFFRTMAHYAARLRLKRSGSCEARGYDALGPYTWTYGCRPFKEESDKAWRQFTGSLEQVKKLADGIKAQCLILISPILYDIDVNRVHSYYNWQNYDFHCATINPRQRLQEIARRLHIGIIDPQDYLRTHFEDRVREGNFEPFFFTTDDNHLTPTMAQYLAEFMLKFFNNLGIN